MIQMAELFTQNQIKIIVGAVLIVLSLIICYKKFATCSIRRKISRKEPIIATDFLDRWDDLRGQDQPGCYVIMIYAHPPLWPKLRSGRGYENVYVGQSIHMYRRVHEHFTGHGNGDVYADIKYKKAAYVRFIPCNRGGLNKTEIELINAYCATRSYNRTRGGAKLR